MVSFFIKCEICESGSFKKLSLGELVKQCAQVFYKKIEVLSEQSQMSILI